jgi:hypothetical protein
VRTPARTDAGLIWIRRGNVSDVQQGGETPCRHRRMQAQADVPRSTPERCMCSCFCCTARYCQTSSRRGQKGVAVSRVSSSCADRAWAIYSVPGGGWWQTVNVTAAQVHSEAHAQPHDVGINTASGGTASG